MVQNRHQSGTSPARGTPLHQMMGEAAQEPCIFLGDLTPLRQMMARKVKNLHISREIRPPPPTVLVGGGGWYCEIILDIRTFLAFRQWPSLAEGLRSGGFQPSAGIMARDPVSFHSFESSLDRPPSSRCSHVLA